MTRSTALVHMRKNPSALSVRSTTQFPAEITDQCYVCMSTTPSYRQSDDLTFSSLCLCRIALVRTKQCTPCVGTCVFRRISITVAPNRFDVALVPSPSCHYLTSLCIFPRPQGTLELTGNDQSSCCWRKLDQVSSSSIGTSSSSSSSSTALAGFHT